MRAAVERSGEFSQPPYLSCLQKGGLGQVQGPWLQFSLQVNATRSVATVNAPSASYELPTPTNDIHVPCNTREAYTGNTRCTHEVILPDSSL
ncbi:hypothetical protein BaRGS_00002681 [Batillaria attramentaria]|uniref:Uncharacterized protein n=1 Tax=Batillaria attramentaria TaxID=370345 RepID=A0ABD0M3M6_9CAEN